MLYLYGRSATPRADKISCKYIISDATMPDYAKEVLVLYIVRVHGSCIGYMESMVWLGYTITPHVENVIY